jgi:hypothetical protein
MIVGCMIAPFPSGSSFSDALSPSIGDGATLRLGYVEGPGDGTEAGGADLRMENR